MGDVFRGLWDTRIRQMSRCASQLVGKTVEVQTIDEKRVINL